MLNVYETPSEYHYAVSITLSPDQHLTLANQAPVTEIERLIDENNHYLILSGLDHQIREQYQHDPQYFQILLHTRFYQPVNWKLRHNIFWHEGKPYIPIGYLRRELIKLVHENFGNQHEHYSEEETLINIVHLFYWPGQRDDVAQIVRNCICQVLPSPTPSRTLTPALHEPDTAH